MKNIILILSLIGSLSIETADAQMKGDTYYLPAIDVTAEKSQAISAKDVPLKYAVGTEIKDIYHKKNKSGETYSHRTLFKHCCRDSNSNHTNNGFRLYLQRQ